MNLPAVVKPIIDPAAKPKIIQPINAVEACKISLTSGVREIQLANEKPGNEKV